LPTRQRAAGITRNLEGSFGIRFLITQSFVPAGNFVPFYFQPTLGGSDINGTPSLASYQDYRFRAPNNILARASFEHSIYNLPLGVTAMIDEGKVAPSRSGFHPPPSQLFGGINPPRRRVPGGLSIVFMGRA